MIGAPPTHLGAVRIVRGDDWLRGEAEQQRQRRQVRRAFDRVASTYVLVTQPVETTEFNEQRREVRLEITARGVPRGR